MGTVSECLGATHLSLHTCWSLLWQQLGREKMEIVRTQTVSSIDRKEVLKLTLFWVHSLDTILSSSIFLWNSKAKLQVQKQRCWVCATVPGLHSQEELHQGEFLHLQGSPLLCGGGQRHPLCFHTSPPCSCTEDAAASSASMGLITAFLAVPVASVQC